MKIQIALVFLITFVICLPTRAEEIYFCSEDSNTGLNFDQASKRFIPSNFKEQKFRMKISDTKRPKEYARDYFPFEVVLDAGSWDATLECGPKFDWLDPDIYFCNNNIYSFKFNSRSKVFTMSSTFGNITKESINDAGDSMYVSVGTCSKF